ncbi:MAG: nuclear transport factor 2 family protein [Gammaproteobacteria bacterium]
MQADDYFAIQNLLFSYPYALDRGDFDAVGRIFRHADVHSGGQLMASRDPERVAAAFRDWVITDDGSPRTRHYLANVMIEPRGEDEATVRSYVMVFQQAGTLALQPVIGGDYLDTVRKVDGEWRFVERRMGNDLVGDLSAHGRDSGTIRPFRANP